MGKLSLEPANTTTLEVGKSRSYRLYVAVKGLEYLKTPIDNTTFSSSNTSVASAKTAGGSKAYCYVKGLKAGKTKITGKVGSKSVSSALTVEAARTSIVSATINSIPTQKYTGRAIKPKVTVKMGSKKLTQGKDYTVSYSNNVSAGTAKVTVTGKGNYTGTKYAYFTIKKTTSTTSTVVTSKQSLSNCIFCWVRPYYQGKPVTPTIYVYTRSWDKQLVQGRDYTVTYKNNNSKGTMKAYVTGKGNYTGTVLLNIKVY